MTTRAAAIAGGGIARRGRRAIAAAFLALVLLPTSLAGAPAPDNALEYGIKATYLYKFMPFVRWPDGAFDSPTSSFNICIAGRDPFGDLLDRAVRDQRFGERAIVVRRLQEASRGTGCQVLFVAGAEASVAEALKRVSGTPVLTVTDVGHEAGISGIINFITQDNRVRFEIDNQAATENGLVISSKLLSLASSVRSRPMQRSE